MQEFNFDTRQQNVFARAIREFIREYVKPKFDHGGMVTLGHSRNVNEAARQYEKLAGSVLRSRTPLTPAEANEVVDHLRQTYERQKNAPELNKLLDRAVAAAARPEIQSPDWHQKVVTETFCHTPHIPLRKRYGSAQHFDPNDWLPS